MKHRIDPKVDCVFKAVLGSEENRNLLAHFLNAVLGADLSVCRAARLDGNRRDEASHEHITSVLRWSMSDVMGKERRQKRGLSPIIPSPALL